MKSIGQRNRLVVIEKRTEVSDGGGGHVVTYVEIGREKSLIEPLSANEAQLASQVTAVLTTGVTMPYRSDISVKDRLATETLSDIALTEAARMALGTKFLEIESIQPSARREELRLLCAEATA